MDPVAFNSTFEGILSHNEKEGPNTNIFEPKFQARENAEKLIIAIKNALKDSLPVANNNNKNDGDDNDDDKTEKETKEEEKED